MTNGLYTRGLDSPSNENIGNYKYKGGLISKDYIDNKFKVNELKYDFDDILIIPKSKTSINSRSEVSPYYVNKFGFYRLPLFTAPMDTVVNIANMHQFQARKIDVVLPRTENHSRPYAAFTSFGLSDKPMLSEHDKYVLLDIANGHMNSVIDWCIRLKDKYPQLEIMAGNIANPETYELYCISGVIDYARIGIGNGNGCLTTQQTGIGYPMASLIIECNKIKKKYNNQVKIVADGGMKKYSDIIKALALGSDYVMVGSIFSKALESAAPLSWNGIKLNNVIGSNLYRMGFNVKKEFRGMSTKQAQKAMGKTIIKTSEGVVRKYNIEYTLDQWVDNFEHYLRSAMSYTDSRTLEEFIGEIDYNIISNNSFNRFNK